MGNNRNSIQEAKELKDEGKYEESLKLLRKLNKEGNSDQNQKEAENIKKTLIEVLFEYGHHLTDEWILQYDKARDIFKEITELEPQNHRAFYNLGICLFYMQKYEEALINFNKALKIKPDYKFCHYNIGLLYEDKNQFKKALKAYNRALKIDPDFSYAKQAKRNIERAIETDSLPSSTDTEDSKVQQLKSLLRVSRKININDIRDILDLERKNLLPIIVEWAEDYGFEIDGDYLVLNEESLSEFLKDLNGLLEDTE